MKFPARTMPDAEALILRTLYTETATRGHYFLDDSRRGWSLEDRIRPPGQKIPGITCIPAGRYRMQLTWSNRFSKLRGKEVWLPEIYPVPMFEGVRAHGGNRPVDSDGCPLIARETKAADWIFGSLEQELVDRLLKSEGLGWFTIINGPGHEKYTSPT